MSLTRPSLASLQARTSADVSTRITGSAPSLRRGILAGISNALTGGLHALYGFLQARSLQAVPYTATETDLERFAGLWGVPRKQASASNGALLLTGAPTSPIAADTRLQSASGIEFAVDADAVIAGDGTAAVSVTALTAGAAGNQVAGAVLTFISPLAGVNATATAGADGLGGGADVEDDDSLRARMLDAIQSPAHGGSAADYVRWARSISSITRAWCFPIYRGPGSVRVYIINDDYAGPELASAADVSAVYDYINSDEIKPVGLVIEDPDDPGEYVNGLEVLAPTAAPVDFAIDDVPDDLTARAKIEAALKALFLREAVPEGSIALNKLIVTIGANTGVVNFTMSAPTVSPSAGAGEILTLGEITWS